MKIRTMMGSWARMGMRLDFYLPLLSIVMMFTFNPTFILASDITGTNIPNTIYGTMGDYKILGKDGKDNFTVAVVTTSYTETKAMIS